MRLKVIIYAIFYTLCFALSIFAGIKIGFTDTHTPPLPFVIELFTLTIGFIFFVIDSIKGKSTKVHQVGLTANGLVMAFVLILAFR